MWHLDKIVHNSDSYFDQRACQYENDSNRWPWVFVRSIEAKAIDQMVGDLSGLSVLDLGCGTGYYAKRYANKMPKNLAAVDVSRPMINQINDKRIDCFIGDAAEIKLQGFFDIIISAGLLEFVPDFTAVLKNARRHINKSGKLVLLIPKKNVAGFFYTLFHKRNGNLVRLFDLEKFCISASHCGWTLESYSFVFPFSIVASFKIAPT